MFVTEFQSFTVNKPLGRDKGKQSGVCPLQALRDFLRDGSVLSHA